MKYLIRNDISDVIKENKKVLIMYFSLNIFLVLFGAFYLGLDYDDTMAKTLGLVLNFEKRDTIEIMAFTFNLAFYIYLFIYIFTKDLTSGLDNIFLRMKSEKWLIGKFISILIICAFFLFINYFLYIIAMLLTGNSLFFAGSLYLKHLLFYLVCGYAVILLFIVGQKISFILVPITFILLFTLNSSIDIRKMNYSPLIFLLVAIISLSVIIFRKTCFFIHEKRRDYK